jgi:hypothetical protein
VTAPARVLVLPAIESQLTTTIDWLLIREAAIEGLRLKIATEERGMELERRAGRDDQVALRLVQLEQLGRALKRATAWKPIVEIPRRK